MFTGNIQNDYLNNINNLNPIFDKFKYIEYALNDKVETLKFYKQTNENYVSQSLIPNMFGNSYDIVKSTTIKNIMNDFNHTNIDLLKLDIEGSEIDVLNNMLDDNILPRYLCIEFDLLLKNKDHNNLTKNLIKRLIDNNYKILKNDKYNITFINVIY
jgi:FkbM family methyltransferase